jgi:hypothetical protein
MLIGVDFDNTIICYDDLFHRIALERRLIPDTVPPFKNAVRDFLRQAGQEDHWTEMQGYVYGARVLEAHPFPGVIDFFKRCGDEGVDICIISHKTLHPYAGPRYDLHQATFDWLKTNGFLDDGPIGLTREKVFLEPTKEDKLERIGTIGCTHFVDDLPEFLSLRDFPQHVLRILFDPKARHIGDADWVRFSSWEEFPRMFLSESSEST